ncbi:DUF3533 domain-containing protein [Mycobacterium sp. CVI_P3]|uniref:DUF3533 domain-containing protein n=1 Tax=Mycobacterium pinniadriaticum TaxID=2994102 RepID=A0ABT3S8V8_9MYCO|nr:DUF3533 domain-containing protein [Mycobacterium pinniadriaticum]MCX2929509.1 DUF3533 domain-containing protein [Mycobacterium pinniadriaticum]MCX2935933.1 DUF3533 domain-containing protein [Mycobacterium pinniadriaticum]
MPDIPPEIRKAAAVIAIAIVLASSFAAAYTVALGRPAPRNLPVGVVGSTAVTAPFVNALHRNPREFDVHQYATRGDAITDINQQRITAAIDATAAPPELLLSSASDPSGARALIQLDQTQPGRFILPVVDLHPLPPSDPMGMATFYLVIAATILGFITMFQLRANVKGLSLRTWLACVAILAVVGGAALAVVTGPVLGALSTPFGQLWLLISMQIGTAALFNSTMLVLIHRWAIIPTWLLFILLGNTSSGGAVSASLLPQPFAFFNHALPSGATVSAIHAATYFPDSQRTLPYLILGLWLVGSLTALLISSRALHRTPAV